MVTNRRTGRIHVIGVCGRATGALAEDLAKSGFAVSGSDENAFGPILDSLARSNIDFFDSFDRNHLSRDIDKVIVGTCHDQENPEVQAALDLGIPITNFPKFVAENLITAKERLVVTGTNGKTTTSTMLTFILKHCGRDPDYLIGGNLEGFQNSAKFKGSDYLVIEGDEYPGGHWDSDPKCFSYKPTVGILTNIYHDHPEIYRDARHNQYVFRQFVDMIPPDGLLVANADDPNSAKIIKDAQCRVETVGFSENADYQISGLATESDGITFQLLGQKFQLSMFGSMNALNAAMAVIAASRCGITVVESREVLAEFKGISDRQQIHFQSDQFTLLSDIAYHPHAISNLLGSVRMQFPGRRLVLALQPQNTRIEHYARDLADSLKEPDLVYLTDPHNYPQPEEVPSDSDLSIPVSEEWDVFYVDKPIDVPSAYTSEAKPGDVLVSCLGFRSESILHQLRQIGENLR